MPTALPQRFTDFYSRLGGSRFHSPWGMDEWLAYFHECAAIAEYDGNTSRQSADDLAYKQCVEKWRRQRDNAR